MREPRVVLILLVIMSFGLSLMVPAEDVPETPYDESEALPYESTPAFSIVVPHAVVSETRRARSALYLGSSPVSSSTNVRINGKDAAGSPQGRDALALLCTLRC
jgi:hypothetical protein